MTFYNWRGQLYFGGKAGSMGVNKTEGSYLDCLKNGANFSEEINVHQ